MRNIDFDNSRKWLRFLNSDDLSNRNRNQKVCSRKMSCENQIMAIFVSALYGETRPCYGNFKIWLTFGPGDIIDDIGVRDTYLAQIHTPNKLLQSIVSVSPVLLCVIVWKTSMQTHTHTNKYTGEILSPRYHIWKTTHWSCNEYDISETM